MVCGSAIIYAYVGEFYSKKNVDRAIMATATIAAIGAILLPVLAWLIINSDFTIYIPFLGISYGQWRLYITVCAIPGLLSGLAFFGLPESPKFLLSVGEEKEALRIIVEVMKKDDVGLYAQNLELKEIEALKPISEEEHSNRGLKNLKNMLNQTLLLFSKKYLKITSLMCFLQMMIYATSSGMYMWFPDILNSITEFTKENPDTQNTLCNIYGGKLEKLFNVTDVMNNCNSKFEISTYTYSIITDISVVVGCGIFTYIITKVPNTFLIWITLTLCGLATIAEGIISSPTVSIYLYIILINSWLVIAVVSSATASLYPTSLRVMAVNMSIMFGRIGASLGANFIGALLKGHCELTFYICGAIMCFTGFVAFLIPKPKTN
ncbi:hypothetical protein ACFFRR_007081 [Megaselia abdita]